MQSCDSPPTWYARLLCCCAAVLLLGTLIASPAWADIYKWVDAQGRLHFTDDPASVPAAHGARSVDAAPRDTRWNVMEREASVRTERASSSEATSGKHVVRLEKSGLQLRVRVMLNNAVSASFVVDTGAMMNSIPRSLIDKLGIRIDARTPRVEVRGITGQAQLAPVVTLRNVKLGGAVVEQVEVVVLDSLDTGLLGMSFFNHFRVQIDPVRELLTLEEIASVPNVGSTVLDYRFNWGTVMGASRYYLEISSDRAFTNVVEQTWVSGTSADLRSLDADGLGSGNYFWRVAAVDEAGARGPWTAPRGFRYR
ncbi:MAG: aspartyl protease family protein [Myxococcota bacterium]